MYKVQMITPVTHTSLVRNLQLMKLNKLVNLSTPFLLETKDDIVQPQ